MELASQAVGHTSLKPKEEVQRHKFQTIWVTPQITVVKRIILRKMWNVIRGLKGCPKLRHKWKKDSGREEEKKSPMDGFIQGEG